MRVTKLKRPPPPPPRLSEAIEEWTDKQKDYSETNHNLQKAQIVSSIDWVNLTSVQWVTLSLPQKRKFQATNRFSDLDG